MFVVILFAPSYLLAQQIVPFKLGTFEDGAGRYLGLVLGDNAVVNIAQANDTLAGPKPDIPTDMKELIVRYPELRSRMQTIAAAASSTGNDDADYVAAIETLKILPPLIPNIIYAAGSNYSDHAAEMDGPSEGPPPGSIRGIWEREPGDSRQNPYVFIKLPSTIIADGEAIRMMPRRESLDYECEFAAVIDRTATRVPPEDAEDFIFGYTLLHDVSDRGGRPDETPFGADWLLMKNHDTWAPLGPFIVPKEFVPNPHNLRQTLTLNGTLMQDSTTANMTHNSFDILSFVSHNLTMHPGDVIAMGTPAGVGVGRNPPVFMKAGDVAACTIESIGTLTNPVVAY
jgi:2-keto-4-pentenoate hydratase/2-oxohepta-3-ene-1,7-dioic acid hydratase in catechol pathway